MRGPVPSRPALRLRAVRAPVGGCGAPISGSHFGFLRLAGYGRGVGSRPALPEGTGRATGRAERGLGLQGAPQGLACSPRARGDVAGRCACRAPALCWAFSAHPAVEVVL